MRETIGRGPIQKALTEGRADIETHTKELIQKMLDEYQSGIVINSVQLLRVDPPAPVVDAFDDVQRARADKERTKNEAETYRNDIVPRARGDARPDSDLDVLVETTPHGEEPRFDYFKAVKLIEDQVGLQAQISMRDLLKPRIAERIADDLVEVF